MGHYVSATSSGGQQQQEIHVKLPVLFEMYIHSDKAVKKGHPSDRLFLVYCDEKDFNGGHDIKIAWKCRITDLGIVHPAADRLLQPEELKDWCIKEGKNGSTPTAVFPLDCFYRKVSLDEVRRLISTKV